jgi:hypothetical protein
MNVIHYATSMPSALMNAAAAGWDMTCRMVGACRHGGPIDNEYGDMLLADQSAPNWTGPKQFAYLRYDPEVTARGLRDLGLTDIDPAWLQAMDSVEHIQHIRRVGIEYAAQHIKLPEHFRGFL